MPEYKASNIDHKSTITRKELFAACASYMYIRACGPSKHIALEAEILEPFVFGLASMLGGCRPADDVTAYREEFSAFVAHHENAKRMDLMNKLMARNKTARKTVNK